MAASGSRLLPVKEEKRQSAVAGEAYFIRRMADIFQLNLGLLLEKA
jgi:hypothetical protein